MLLNVSFKLGKDFYLEVLIGLKLDLSLKNFKYVVFVFKILLVTLKYNRAFIRSHYNSVGRQSLY